ncbi:MAG: V-type ATP synthase subunit D [Candidatus Methanofastidiosia archaeon]
MAIAEIKPTRSELLEVKKRIALSRRGHQLLKMKRDGLILEFFEIMEKAKDVRRELDECYERAKIKISIARAVEGVVALKSAAFALKENPQIQVRSKNIMGIVVPEIEFTSVKKRLDERGYGIIGTSARLDEAVEAWEEFLEKIIAAAEIETSMKRLLDEIEKTKRRTNALEFVVIPALEFAKRFIKLRLEERERDDIFRLKKIKVKGRDE